MDSVLHKSCILYFNDTILYILWKVVFVCSHVIVIWESFIDFRPPIKYCTHYKLLTIFTLYMYKKLEINKKSICKRENITNYIKLDSM